VVTKEAEVVVTREAVVTREVEVEATKVAEVRVLMPKQTPTNSSLLTSRQIRRLQWW